jgi:uncharacterized protein (TIGR02246 family)
MTKKLFVATLLLSSLPLAACNKPADQANGTAATVKADTSQEAAAVKAVESDMLAGFQAKDGAKVSAQYAPDALVATPGRSMKGSEAINKAISDDLADPAFKLNFTNDKTDVASGGDLAYTSGTYTVDYTDPKTKKVEKGSGTYVTVFRKQADGTWKAVADISTPGAPS